MNRVAFAKRDLLRACAVLPIGVVAMRVQAQKGSILGLDIPREILNALPRKPLNYLRIAETVVRLESEADIKGLPQSSLALGKGASLADIQESLYQMALPRLVALIDRSESIDAQFADKAGQLLAELHQSQHVIPDALRAMPLLLDSGMSATDQRNFIVPPVTETVPSIEIVVPDMATPTEPPITAPSSSPTPSVNTEEPEQPLSHARDYASLREEYGRMFRQMTVRPQYAEIADWHLQMMRKSKARYERVAEQTGVPWHFIAVTHGLEASFNFRAHLHNGDFPLSARTRQVPAGRPSTWLPPSDWESSARDALRLLGFTGQKDWSLERTLYRLEAYNGLGYRGVGVPTPYLWSFSNHYDRGKFVSDGKFSRTAKSQQCGAAVMLKVLADVEEVKFTEMT